MGLLAVVLLLGVGFWWSNRHGSGGGSLVDQKTEIIGTWRNNKGQESQFFPNGDLVGTAGANQVVKARYEWMTEKHMKVTSVTPRAGVEVIQKVEITGDTMQQTTQDGKVEVWQRVRE